MKNLFFLVVFIVYGFGSSHNFIEKYNYEVDYKSGLEKAKKANKPILLVLSTKTCPWCRKFERQTLKKEVIDNIIKANFIPIALDKNSGIYPKKFTPKVVPTVYFIDPKDQSIIFTSYGYKNKNNFKKILLDITKDSK